MAVLKSKERKQLKFKTAKEIEVAVALWFNIRTNIIVPNIHWGLINYEADLFVLHKSMHATEVEIKVSVSDLKADSKKDHKHDSKLFRKLYFAMPDDMDKHKVLVPEKAGILLVDYYGRVREARKPKVNALCRKLTEKEAYQLLRLGNMRIWNIKKKQILGG